MPNTDPYISVEDFKARTNLTDVRLGQDDVLLTVVTAASRQIDATCGKPDGGFNQTGEEARFFTPSLAVANWIHPGLLGLTQGSGAESLEIGDFVSISEFASDPGGDRSYNLVIDPTDYDVAPYDAPARGRPYTRVVQSNRLNLYIPWWSKAVRVTGVWGWPAVPSPIKEATYLLANRLRSLWTAPFGVQGPGSGDMGGLNMTQATTPIIAQMVAPYQEITL